MGDERVAVLRERAVALVRDVLEERLGEQGAAPLVAEVRERLDTLGEAALGGVDPPRTDFGDAWEQARGRAYVQTERVGAVHLELGSWSAFPDARVSELAAADGLAEFIRLDSDPRWAPELVADARALPLATASVDRIASNSTLEHIPDPRAVLAESHRVLRPGGVMVVVMPYVWHEHGYPEDHVRLTRGYFERVLPELGFVDVCVDRDGSSGLYYALHQASKMAEIDAARAEHATMRELQIVLTSLLGALIPFDRFFVDGAREWQQSVRVVARKAGAYEPSRRERRPGVRFAERALDLLADPQTKQPLRRDGDRLVNPAGVAYAVSGDSINFLEPRLPSPDARRWRAAARRVARRAR